MNSFICLVFLSLSVIVSSESLKHITTDEIRELRKELFVTRNYDKYAIPIPKKDVLRIQLQYSIIHLRDFVRYVQILNLDHAQPFCIKTQTIVTDGWLRYQWHDESLIWEGKESKWNHIKVLRVPSSELYLPDIMAYNGIDYTTKKMVEINALIYPNGLVLWIPPVTTKALCRIDLSRWPYDEHICFLKFGSWTHDGLIMDVKSLNQTHKTVTQDLWQNSEFDIQFLNVTDNETYYPCCKEPYPSVIFYFKLQRKPTLYHWIISVPALVAVISSLITFWFPIISKIRLLLNGISFLTLTLLLLYVGFDLGWGSIGVPIAVRFLSLTILFIGVIQIWFTIGFNVSKLKCQIPLWTMKLTKPILQLYKDSEHETIHLTQPTDQSTDVSKKSSSQPTAEDLIFVIDKIIFVVFTLALIVITVV